MSPVITLRLLGSPAIESDGQVLTGRAAQKRRLAVLSVLALAPARTLTRDRVMAYLWPESDTAQARHLLAVAIYELRKVLGEDVVLTRGDDVELNAARVTSDVEAFEAACQAGELDRAVELYAGPLLDGFHIGDAPDFERWADAERDRLAQRHAAAVERLARGHAQTGDVVGAVELWRKLANLDPYNSRIARELMLALEAAGDRAGALQLARVHTVLLREEYGAEPDAEFVALAERLRSTRAPAAPVAVQHVVATPPVTLQQIDPTPPLTTVPSTSVIVEPEQLRPVPVRKDLLRRRVVWAALFAGAVAIIAWPVWKLRAGAAPAATPERVAIAVLPFRNLEPTADYEHFGTGVSEEIARALGRLPELRVVGGPSTVTMRGDENPAEAGALLHVGYIVRGSIRTGGDRMYVNASLDDSTGQQIWSDRFDRPLLMEDKVAVQEEIARAVVDKLQLTLPGTAAGPLVATTTSNMEAYNLYLEGRDLFELRTAEGLGASLRYFQEAVKLDSDYALAYAAQAEVLTLLGAYDYSVLEPKQAFEGARAAARKALSLDPDLAQAYAALGSIAFNYDRNAVEAERAFEKALEVNGGYAQAYHWYSLFLSTRSRMDDARMAMRHAGELDPISMVMRTALARQSYFERHFDQAIAGYTDAITRDSTFVRARLGLALSYAGAGRLPEAIAEIEASERLLKGPQPVTQGLLGYVHGRLGHRDVARRHLATLQTMAARAYVAPEYFVIIHIGLGDHDSAFEALERAFEIRSGGIAYLAIEPIVDPLTADPRFVKLLRRAGL